ncbi:cyclic nucleotide-binding domain-containing protein [Patescibacteria group bacterium]|nr:cyclic nucleotide-binding domain-containing protein [Patescibacteria group bacterium]
MISSIFAVLRNIPALEGVEDSVLREISSKGKNMKYKKGDFVFKQDEPGDLFYVIKSGKVDVIREFQDGTEESIVVLYDDNFFGEMALLSDNPRNASIKCLDDCELIAFNKIDFYGLFKQ